MTDELRDAAPPNRAGGYPTDLSRALSAEAEVERLREALSKVETYARVLLAEHAAHTLSEPFVRSQANRILLAALGTNDKGETDA